MLGDYLSQTYSSTLLLEGAGNIFSAVDDPSFLGLATNAGNAFVPERLSKGVSSMVGKGQWTQQAGNVLNGGINVKSSVADFMINSYQMKVRVCDSLWRQCFSLGRIDWR